MVLPIDFQDNFSKTQIVEKTQQIQQAHPEMAQRAITRGVEEDAVQRPREAPPSVEPDQVIIYQDNPRSPHEPQSRRRRRRVREEGGGEAEEEAGSETETQHEGPLQHIDVVV
ncbi:MAG: hypothetical protein HY709_01170 [Candidatus Latescibacteria bacterium]|nr:hypothetical protein [Candidatus Latescibacterota bacterium]